MTSSDQINELAGALAKAQGEMKGAKKDSENPFFKSSYADLASCYDACREPLAKNGLAIIQGADTTGDAITVETMLTHASGQWVASRLVMKPEKATPQGIGSCITYARRYALAAMVGIAQVDDDAEGAEGRGTGGKKNPVAMPKKQEPLSVDEIASTLGAEPSNLPQDEGKEPGEGNQPDPEKDKRRELTTILMELSAGDVVRAQKVLVDITGYATYTNKAGKTIEGKPGVESTTELSAKRLDVALGKARTMKKQADNPNA